ncbi:uncharacterized protein F5147DRAFT_661612, partial [Suillus discolor]
PIATTSRTYSHAVPSSSESGLVGPGSILGSSILESSYMGSSAYPEHGGDASTDASSPITKPTRAKKAEKVMLQYINSKYPKWASALGNLRSMIQVAMCHGDTDNLFLLIMAEYASERKALIESIWPQALICCNLQPTDLEPVLAIPTKNIMSEAEILALGDPWFSLWMYDNKRHAHDSMMINCTGFDLKYIFGVALHDKAISLTLKLMRLRANCLPLAENGLVWFLENQITQELVYHMIFRNNNIPGHRVSLADLDPVSFRNAAHPPICYEVLLDYIDSEAEDSHKLIPPNEMFLQICEILPVLFNQSDDPDHVSFVIAMKVLCTLKKGNVQRVKRTRQKAKKASVVT